MADQQRDPERGQDRNPDSDQYPNPTEGQRESNVPGERPSEAHDEGTRRKDESSKGGDANRPIEDEQRDRQAPGAPDENPGMDRDA
jgi:hypothetical protein